MVIHPCKLTPEMVLNPSARTSNKSIILTACTLKEKSVISLQIRSSLTDLCVIPAVLKQKCLLIVAQ